MKAFLTSLAFGLFALVGSASAETLNWNFQATVTATGADTVGIDSEVLTLNLFFDTTDTWVQSGAFWYFPTISNNVSLTGGNTVALGTAFPAALVHNVGQAGFVESTSSTNYLDFIINGTFLNTINFIDAFSNFPSAGDNLLASHLITTMSSSAGLDLNLTDGFQDYYFSGIAITISPVPLPASLPLLVIGLGGLGLLGRRRRKEMKLRGKKPYTT